MKKTLFILTFAALSLSYFSLSAQVTATSLSAKQPLVQNNEQIRWSTIENAAQLKNNDKFYFVDFYTTWCGWCKRMDRDVFTDSTISALLNKYYVPVKFNAEGASEFTWQGKKFVGTATPPGARAQVHNFAKTILGQKLGFPSFAVFDANRNLLTVLQGYQPVDDLKVILWYIASGDYKKIPFERYQTIFDKEIRPVMETSF